MQPAATLTLMPIFLMCVHMYCTLALSCKLIVTVQTLQHIIQLSYWSADIQSEALISCSRDSYAAGHDPFMEVAPRPKNV